MKKILVVPPLTWGDREIATLRAALNGSKEHVSFGTDPALVNWYHFALIFPGEDYAPGFLRDFGERVANRNKLIYVSLPLCNVAEKIESLVNPKHLADEAHA